MDTGNVSAVMSANAGISGCAIPPIVAGRRGDDRPFCYQLSNLTMTSDTLKRLLTTGALTGLTVASIFEVFAGSTEPVVGMLRGTAIEPVLLQLHNGNSILFNLAIGFLTSAFFWLLVVYLPERRLREILRSNLRRRYREFREGVIGTLLGASDGSYDPRLREELCDHQKFREYFGSDKFAKWYAALNEMQSRPELLGDIVMEMKMLSDEVAYVFSRVDVSDEGVHRFFRRLNEHLYRLKNESVYSYDPVKYVGRFVYGILAHWDIATGEIESDIIDDMIRAI
ncbi:MULTISPECIES: hypothetical protein [unclassified Caballeronia]|uniref:hypothetical protein n=1 Tax=unclassified Caballeronia TaxID=2646786 RepID=UPI002027B7AA|nr:MULTISPECIES: hypothetical protein [unclassified Caballeronia]